MRWHLAGGAYSAPPYPLAGKGGGAPPGKGKEREGEGGEGEGLSPPTELLATALSVSTAYTHLSEFSSSWRSLSTEPFTALLLNICPTYCVTLLTYRQDVVFDRHCSLPNDITSAPSMPVFRRKLKTYLFQRSYPDIVIVP